MKTTLLIDNQYFPPIPVVACMRSFDQILLEKKEKFQKSSFRNRCCIYNTNGFHTLSVPLKNGRNQNKLVSEIELDHSYHWQRIHWNSIQSAYGRSPYFEFYSDSLSSVFQTKFQTLWALNLASLNWLFEQLQVKKKVHETDLYSKEVGSTMLDMRSYFLPKTLATLNQQNLPTYLQVFEDKHGFISNLSCLDLIFNLGPESATYLKNYAAAMNLNTD